MKLTSLFKTANESSTPSSNTKQHRNLAAPARRKSGEKKAKPIDPALLPEAELDKITEFIQYMKKTNLGENLLDEFVVKQVELVDGDLEDHLKEREPVPIRAIEVVRPAPKTGHRKPTAAISA